MRTLGRGEMHRAVELFSDAMRGELARNMHKPGWEDSTPAEMTESLLYHAAKLTAAVELQHPAAIREYAADVANEALMVADCAGVLSLPPAANPVLIGEVVFDVEGSADGPLLVGRSDGGEMADSLGELAKKFVGAVKMRVATARESQSLEVTEGKVG